MPSSKKGTIFVSEEKLVAMVEALQRGDPGAFDVIHATFHGYLERYFCKKIPDYADVQELVESTLLTAHKKINRLKKPVAFIGWLKRIAYRKCYHYYKKQEKIKLLATEPTDMQKLPDIPIVQKSSSLGEVKSELYEAIDRLPEKQRQAMLLQLQGYKVKEIAQIQDVSIGTVKSRLNYGRIKLHKDLGNYLEKHNIHL